MKRSLFFDIGNVLLEFNHYKMCRQISEYCKLDLASVYKIVFEKKLGTAYELGQISSKDLFDKFTSYSPKKLNFQELLKILSNTFEVKDEMYKLVLALKQKGHQLILLSNTCEAHFEFAKKNFPIIKLFDRRILSYEVGLKKPDPKIYQKALQLADMPPSRCFYIDDIPEYIFVARREGIEGECFIDPPLLKKTLTIRRFF